MRLYLFCLCGTALAHSTLFKSVSSSVSWSSSSVRYLLWATPTSVAMAQVAPKMLIIFAGVNVARVVQNVMQYIQMKSICNFCAKIFWCFRFCTLFSYLFNSFIFVFSNIVSSTMRCP